jgi:hypothetical protein
MEDLVEHVRPGVLPRRETVLDRLARHLGHLGGAWSARGGRPLLAERRPPTLAARPLRDVAVEQEGP